MLNKIFNDLSSLLPIITILTFIKAIYEYVRSRKWKMSEYLTKEVKEFFNDPRIETVCLLLDWNSRKIKLGGKEVIVDDEFLYQSLLTHEEKNKFTTDEAEIRDLFDHFFDRLSYFNIYLENKLIEEKETFNYLSYYLNIIVKPGRKNKELIKVINRYISHYEFYEVQNLLRKFTKSDNKLYRFCRGIYCRIS